MHHMYPGSKGDPLCPLGFHPQVRWPTRCKRCFRDYKDHGGKSRSIKDTTSSTPSLSVREQSAKSSAENSDSKRTWASTSNLLKDESKSYITPEVTVAWNSALDLTSVTDNTTEEFLIVGKNKTIRPKTYAGSQSDSLNFRRHSVDESAISRPQKLQISRVINKSNGNASDTDAEFIIQVRKSRTTEADISSKGEKENSVDSVNGKGGKTEKNETEKLRAQLHDLRVRCERAEKEKSEILLRRLSSMDSVSNGKSTSNDVMKLQKSIKELQAKNEALSEEKGSLSSKLKNLEKELSQKTNKSEREKLSEELKSKLKAAETLCETLMDENEDMKKEIREMEEEIYEMQDNFRDEQADEYSSLRKNLEQSNKNCRILSFKLRKFERRAEQLETEKVDLEKKYDQAKKIEDILKQVGNEYKNKSQKKNMELESKVHLKKMMDDIDEEIGDVLGMVVSAIEGGGVGLRNSKANETNLKYETLSKEHGLLKEKLEKTLKELSSEKETKKSKVPKTEDGKNGELQSINKKLEDTIALTDIERKSWDVEKGKLQEEKEKLKSKLLSLSAEKLKVYNEVVQLKKDLETATSSKKDNAKMETVLSDLRKELAQEKERNKKLQEDLTSFTEKETRISKALASVEQTKIQLEGDLKLKMQEIENMKSTSSKKIADLTTELDKFKKEKDQLKTLSEKDKQSKDLEITTLKKRIASLEKTGLSTKKMNEMKQTYNERILNLENEVKKSLQQFDELHVKHEKLVESRTQLEGENQTLNSRLLHQQSGVDSVQAELINLQQTLKSKENEWNANKINLDEKIRELERAATTHSQDEIKEEIDRLRRENSSMKEQLNDLKKANDDLNSKLNDYNSVTKIQRNFSADSSALESELRKAKNALANAEKAKKADLAQCKMRYEHRISAINDEIQSIQTQLSRYKRERDTYKHMLEGAQKTIAELKIARQRRHSTTSNGKSTDEDEETSLMNVTVLEKQILSMEDELSETKLEASKLKTELVSEKSAWQIKLSEMQSRINELEEERLLSSGRTKIPGLKVRMELAWQKEREDQHRLLQETATLARDLRQTLFEVERERDKERLENKRKQDQLKKVFDEEKDDNKKKLIELQCDLLELRDAHAKLRTSNEKMRREKERHEREREELKTIIANKRHIEQTEARNINILLQQVDDLMKLFPELKSSTEKKPPEVYTPTPPRRLKGPKSRESSPMLETKDDKGGKMEGRAEKLEYTIGKLMEVAKELQESKKSSDESTSNRTKKFGKRSTSIDNDTRRGTTPSRKPTLKRKSLSLEQTTSKNDQSIWGNDSNVSSMQSLDGSEVDSRHFSIQRDSSVDSRLSGGSTKSEMLHREKKYSKSIIKKLTTKLTKSASVDDPNSSMEFSLQTSGSEVSINEDVKRDKKNLKKKLTDMFKRGSKSNGLDKKSGSQDTSRPSSRNSLASSKNSKP
ncbi:golgin IMH1 isoform X2 [Belonocnema kinseyi]|uniref:golgin IMH1 isoform X2 n=1 Tax=Belonocnema kinseyi TaxID=2817044 RepID=UPI00143CC629|nr:golgin IMH1 isoform X2 [Belonocnema kinseyi]